MNNQYENIATALLLVFVIAVPSCQHSQASNIKNHLPTTKDNGYDGDLSKLTSVQPIRYLLAFFVSDICLASQARQVKHIPHTYLSQDRTVYDGATSQNKKAFGRICGAVASKTESEPRHPIPFVTYSVALTQNLLGAIHHG